VIAWALTNWKMIGIAALAVALAAGAWRLWHAIDQAGYTRAQTEYQAAAEFQRESNRGRSRQAEEKQATQTVYRDRYIYRATKELDHASQDLASHPLPAAAIRLLNDAAGCADEDRCPTGGAGDGVPAAR
jgi:nitrogen fixation protein FixH